MTESARPVPGQLYRPKRRRAPSSGATAGDVQGEPLGSVLGAHRGPRTLISIHPECEPCSRWVAAHLDPLSEIARRWGGTTALLESEVSAGTGGWLAVLDEWDQVFHVDHFGAQHLFPELESVAEWVRFVAIQCEECERPEDPWLS